MQTGDPTKSTNPIGIDLSRLDLTPPMVSDGTQPLKTNFGWSSGGFHPQNPEQPDPARQKLKEGKISSIWQ